MYDSVPSIRVPSLGCGARAVAALAISPMELVKTRMQAAQQPQGNGQQPLTVVLDQLKQESQVQLACRGIVCKMARQQEAQLKNDPCLSALTTCQPHLLPALCVIVSPGVILHGASHAVHAEAA